MAAKLQIHALPKHMTAYTRNGRTMYKYLRRVPGDLLDVLGRKNWDYSLGSDLTKATVKCHSYATQHDQLISRLATDEARDEFIQRVDSEVAAELADLTLNYEDAPKLAFDGRNIVFTDDAEEIEAASGIKLNGDQPDQELWRDTENTIARTASLTAKQALDHLALFAAYAFGDHSYLERIPGTDPLGVKLTEMLKPSHPTDVVSGAVFDALKGALDARIHELEGSAPVNPKHKLSALLENYSRINGMSPQTKAGYVTKIGRLTKLHGDLTPVQYTPAKLQEYRDHLLDEGLPPQSVVAYFHPIKAIFRWALREKNIPGFDRMPTDFVDMPRGGKSLEERRWQRFDDNEIKIVWEAVNHEWGPTSNCRLSLDRRRAFLMAFRVLLHTGLRPVEVFYLRPEDVTDKLIHVQKTKTRIPRTLPLSHQISDFHAYMQAGGFTVMGKISPDSAAGKMSDSFTKTIRAAGMTNDRHVLYSTKDTLVDRLQRKQHSDDVIRGITGHVSGQGHLRHYKTRLNDTPEGLNILRTALNSIHYW